MKKIVALTGISLFALVLGFSATAIAQKKHAPEPVWTGMLANLSDIQTITAALSVFDMARVAQTADALAARETFVSGLEMLPEEMRKRHGVVATLATALADAARAGEEQQVATKIGEVLAECSACHYDLRDAEAREKME